MVHPAYRQEGILAAPVIIRNASKQAPSGRIAVRRSASCLHEVRWKRSRTSRTNP